MTIPELVKRLERSAKARQRVTVKTLPPQLAQFGTLDPPLPPDLQHSLKLAGITRLYAHQTKALEFARAGGHTGIFTPAASGKTLCYNLPVLETMLAHPKATALYLFPLKALAQDQLDTLSHLALGLPNLDLSAAIYDGDTPEGERSAIRKHPPSILLTNPDMLHYGILPNHPRWKNFFSRLQYIVVDEVHIYRGIFGSHMAHVLRRLRRLCEAYGAHPQFICLSATMGDPEAFLAQLTGLSFQVIRESGAPRGKRHLIFWEAKASPYTEAVALASECLEHEYKTIVFAKSRKITELITHWLKQKSPHLANRVSSYRAGYLPEERREIERRLFQNDLLGVITTSALELGIDIGGLDVCILVGYPGTAMSFWQRSGRAGRGAQDSLTILVGIDDALDQYFLHRPEELLAAPMETARLNPENEKILASHLVCAASEWPLTPADAAMYGTAFTPAVTLLVQQKKLSHLALGRDTNWFTTVKFPTRQMSLRSSGTRFVIMDESERILGDIDRPRVFEECHPHAIYLHRGLQYEVASLDLELRLVRVRETEASYYTEPRTAHEMEIVAVKERRQLGEVGLAWGTVKVTEQVIGFARRKIPGQELLGELLLELPKFTFQTEAVWWTFSTPWLDRVLKEEDDLPGGLHAMEHTLIALLPLFTMSDRWDFGGLSITLHPQTQEATIFVYEAHEGGIGLTEYGFRYVKEWMEKTATLLKECPCEEGCPKCIQSPKCGNGNRPLDKTAALKLLKALQ